MASLTNLVANMVTTLDPSKRSDRIVQELITGSIADLTPAAKIAPKSKSNDGCSVERLQKVVDRHWELMPKPTHTLLLGRTPVNLQTLTNFWSHPQWRDFTRGNVAASMSGTSWLLSLTYLKMGQIKEARSLLLNGSFIRQCGVSVDRHCSAKYCARHSSSYNDSPLLLLTGHTGGTHCKNQRRKDQVAQTERFAP